MDTKNYKVLIWQYSVSDGRIVLITEKDSSLELLSEVRLKQATTCQDSVMTDW